MTRILLSRGAARIATSAIVALVAASFFAREGSARAQSLYSSSNYQYEDESGTYVVDEIPDFNSPNSLSSGDDGYGYVNGSNGAPVGSNAWLDAETEAIYERRASRAGTSSVSSGKGAAPRKSQSTGLYGFAVENNAKDGDTFYERWIESDTDPDSWTAQFLPVGLMYPSYLAGRKEPRLQSIITHEEGYGTLWDITLGGRAPILRYGTKDITQPEGWEIELEGAALLRLDWERDRNLAATDYRAGVPIVYGTRRWQVKTGYYHVSSHLGDNYLMDHFRTRKHYSRDAIMLGFSFRPTDDTRLYAEADYAFHCGRTAEPWEFQFGAEYSPIFNPNTSNWDLRPFIASHGHLYEERDFGGYWATQIGVQWRSPTNSLLRLGAEYFIGGDDLYQFHTHFQRKIGGAIWYDF